MYSCHSILECYNLFFGVKLSIRSFCFIIIEYLKTAGYLFYMCMFQISLVKEISKKICFDKYGKLFDSEQKIMQIRL